MPRSTFGQPLLLKMTRYGNVWVDAAPWKGSSHHSSLPDELRDCPIASHDQHITRFDAVPSCRFAQSISSRTSGCPDLRGLRALREWQPMLNVGMPGGCVDACGTYAVPGFDSASSVPVATSAQTVWEPTSRAISVTPWSPAPRRGTDSSTACFRSRARSIAARVRSSAASTASRMRAMAACSFGRWNRHVARRRISRSFTAG